MGRNWAGTVFRAPLLFFLVTCSLEAGSLQVIAKYGDPAPGGGGTFRNFLQLSGVDPAISGENIVFGAVAEEAAGIYAYIDGALVVIADTLTLFPGSKERFGFLGLSGSGASISGRNVVFGAASLIDGTSIWASMNGSLVEIADRSTPMPGTSGTFGNFHLSDGASPSISGENVAFIASSSEGGGIYARISGSLRVIADTKTEVPGQVGVTFMNFGQLHGISPSVSGQNVVFYGEFADGGGIYAYISGELRVIADTNTLVPGLATTFSALASTGGTSPSISGENVAFWGRDPSGIYAYVKGSLRVIADVDRPAPGATGNFRNFGSLDGLGPRISGENVVFVASGEASDYGVFGYIDGYLQLIAGENTQVPGRTTTFNNFGVGVSPAISGENVVFSASPNGVYALLPEPPPIPALSAWWLIVLTLLLVATAMAILRTRAAVRR